MEKQKSFKIISTLCICLSVVAVLLLLLIAFVDVQMQFSGAGECISVAFFEKQKMAKADKIVISAEGKEIIITDTGLIRELVDQTTVATHANLGCGKNRQIDVYNGNKLIRSMKWGTCCDAVKVYETDIFHWLLSPTDLEGINGRNSGWVFLSNELVNKLDALIAQN